MPDAAQTTAARNRSRFTCIRVSPWLSDNYTGVGRIVALDVGERRIGVAVSDLTRTLARPHTALRTTGLDGATPDNPNWVRRKRNCVLRFFKSSYAIGLTLARQDSTLQAKFGLPDTEFAPHGGSFPIVVKGTGCIGAVTVSGLPQREDHNMVVEALAAILGKDIGALKLDA